MHHNNFGTYRCDCCPQLFLLPSLYYIPRNFRFLLSYTNKTMFDLILGLLPGKDSLQHMHGGHIMLIFKTDSEDCSAFIKMSEKVYYHKKEIYHPFKHWVVTIASRPTKRCGVLLLP